MTDPNRQERWTVPVSKLREVERRCEEVTRQMEEEQVGVERERDAAEQRAKKLQEVLRQIPDRQERYLKNARRSAWYWWSSGFIAGALTVGVIWIVVAYVWPG